MTLFNASKDSFNFSDKFKTTKFLTELLSEATEFSAPLCEKVLSEKLLRIKDHKFNTTFIKYLYRLKENKFILKYYGPLKVKELSYLESEVLLELYKELGEIKKFKKYGQKLCEHLLVNKYYPCFARFISKFGDDFKNDQFFFVAKIIFLCDVNDGDALDQVLTTKRASYKGMMVLLELSNKILDNIDKLYHPRIYRHQQFLRYLMELKIKDHEALILADDRDDFSIIIEKTRNEKLEFMLLEYLKNKFEQRPYQINRLFAKVKRLLTQKVEIKYFNEAEQESENLVLGEEGVFPVVLASCEYRYERTKEETDLINYFNYSFYDIKMGQDLVVAFIMMNFYDAALSLARRLETSGSKYYLIAKIYLLKEDFSQCIYWLNIGLGLIKESDLLPYLQLKAKAFERLNDDKSAKKIYAQISSLNARGKVTKEKLVG